MDTFSLPFQEMLEQMPDSVIYADTEGKIRFWNAASEQMFGFTAQEALGQSLDIIIPEYLREPHWRGFYAAVESGRTKHNGRRPAHQSPAPRRPLYLRASELLPD